MARRLLEAYPAVVHAVASALTAQGRSLIVLTGFLSTLEREMVCV